MRLIMAWMLCVMLLPCAGIAQAQSDATEPDPLFAAIPSAFCFMSGVGGWATDLHIHPDGTFAGFFHDSDMGDIGEGYPEGTRYECAFHGKFTVDHQVGEHEYALKLEYLELEKEAGQTAIVDGVRVITAGPYGMDNADAFRLYLPDRETADLPEPFLDWMRWPYVWHETETLQVYGLYNIGGEQGFFAESH